MQIDWWTFALQTINALILILLLARFFFRPVAEIIAARKTAAAQMMDAAAAAQASAQALDAKAAHALAAVAKERSAALSAAAEDAQAAKEATLASARAEAERLRADAQAEVEGLRRAGRRAEAERARLLAVDIARRLFERLPQEAQIAGFIEGLAEAVRALPETARRDFARGRAVLTAPRALTPQEAALCRAALDRACADALDVQFKTDPTILAGLELENEHVSVYNSFRADLARISAEFSAEEES